MPAGDENRWTSTSSTDWGTGANWSLTTPPVDDENVVVGADVADILGGFASDAAAPAVRSFHRHKNSTSVIGTSDDPLVLATQAATNPVNPFDPTGKVIVEGPGGFFYINGAGGAAQTTDLLYIDTDTQDTAIEVDGAIDRLHCIKGRITGLSNFDPATVLVAHRTQPATDVHLTLQGSAGIAFLQQQGGTVINTGAATVSVLLVAGGTFDHGKNAGILSTILQTAGTITHRAATTVVSATVTGGTLDCSQDERAKTILLLAVFPGATFLQNAYVTIEEGGSVFPLTPIIPGSLF